MLYSKKILILLKISEFFIFHGIIHELKKLIVIGSLKNL